VILLFEFLSFRAWYVCFDELLKPKQNDCLIFSFGINEDESFDQEINKNHGCKVHSFDPFVETPRFKLVRNSTKSWDSVQLEINSQWMFYRLGIAGHTSVPRIDHLKFKDMLNFNQILDMTNSRNKVIDVFKIDVEGAETGVLETLDMDYFCRYVKQFVIETHSEATSELLYKLEKCFYLFHRDSRLFLQYRVGPTGYLTEWQLPDGFMLNMSLFRDEVDMARSLFTKGELYFVNLNFVST
jgi:hypothetical protein